MTLVRTTKQPDRVLDVDDAELLDLTRMGLILEGAPATPVTPATASATAGSPPATPQPSAPPNTPSASTGGKATSPRSTPEST